MNIRPLYDRLVVKRVEEQESTRNGIVIPDSAREKPQEGEVIAVGHGKRLEDGSLAPPEVQAGDLLRVARFTGARVAEDDEPHARVIVDRHSASARGHGAA